MNNLVNEWIHELINASSDDLMMNYLIHEGINELISEQINEIITALMK